MRCRHHLGREVSVNDPFATRYERHAVRGRFNAGFFTVLDAYINVLLRDRKRRVFRNLPEHVIEIGPGVGANFRFLAPGTKVTAIEPNPLMHRALRRRARRFGINLELRDCVGESVDLPDESVDAVISSLLLCTVSDPALVVREIRRILRPGGRYAFVEHVAAADGTTLRRLQRIVRLPWSWTFEGCSCERDLASVIRSAGFTAVDIDHYRMRSPFLPANPQIAGFAIA